MEESAPLIEALIPAGLIICYVLLGLALITSIGMPIITAIKHPQGLIKPLIGVVGLVIIFGVAYAVSGSELTAKTAALGVDESSSKLIGAGMITFYFFLISSAVLAIYSLIKDILTN